MARTWTDPSLRVRRGRLAATGLALAALAASGLSPAVAGRGDASADHPQPAGHALTDVVISTVGASEETAAQVVRLGGTVTRRLRVIDGMAARVPADRVAVLRGRPGVRSVTPDRSLSLLSGSRADTAPPDESDVFGAADKGSLQNVARAIRADDAYRAGLTGKGVGVALIDSGVSPVPGLDSGNVVDGPDLSFDSQVSGLEHLDGYGHGTHMASIIAGRDRVRPAGAFADGSVWHGIAPDARLVNVKVGAHDGATDVSQVIAAIDWVVAHRNDAGLNLRVLNLSLGFDSTQSPNIDPLAFAVQTAWRHGIVVVAAAGNGGTDGHRLLSPAADPHVLAVGAADTQGTAEVSDDAVASFSSVGNGARHVDLVAPGISLLGLRDPGSMVDEENPSARVADRFFRGTGTSQAAAVASGAAALLLQRYPSMTPDQVKRQLMTSASVFTAGKAKARGSGLLDVGAAQARPAVAAAPAGGFGDGSGSLEAARGSVHVNDGGSDLVGETDVHGKAWDAAAWADRSGRGAAWDGGRWNGTRWTGDGWAESGWTGRTWVGASWTGTTWSGRTWVDDSWTGRTWVGRTWVGRTWVGRTWVGRTWVGRTWVGRTWVGRTWVTDTWQ